MPSATSGLKTHRLPGHHTSPPPVTSCRRTAPTCLPSGLTFLFLITLCLTVLPLTADADFGKLRIRPYFERQTLSKLTVKRSLLVTRVVNYVTKAVGEKLKIERSEKNLLLKPLCSRKGGSCDKKVTCLGVELPQGLFKHQSVAAKNGIQMANSDFLLLVMSKDTEECKQELTKWSHSTVCTISHRPTSGVLNFCPQKIRNAHLSSLIASTVRDLVHLLGFRVDIIAEHFPTRPCPLRDAKTLNCFSNATKSRKPDLLIATPGVRTFIENHTGSNDVRGIPLSKFGNFWNSFVMFTSVMADSPITDDLAKYLLVDGATVSVLLDSGWYQSDGQFDELLWGRGLSDISNPSCETACGSGVCHAAEREACYKMSPEKCQVCRNLSQLRPLQSTTCIASSCSENARSYTLQCFDKTKKVCNSTSSYSACRRYNFFCLNQRSRGFIANLIRGFIDKWLPTTPRPTPPPQTTPKPQPPNNTRETLRFAFVFGRLDHQLIIQLQLQESVKTQITASVVKILNLSSPSDVNIYKIEAGSTIVHFSVSGYKESSGAVFQALRSAVADQKVTLTIDGKQYKATSLRSHDYSVPPVFVAEIIVGTTMGTFLIIGVVSIIIVLIIKKMNRSNTNIRPVSEAPSSDTDSVYRSNSLQTVSVASYAHAYEHRIDRSVPSIRAASLRNVSVTDITSRTRRSAASVHDESNV